MRVAGYPRVSTEEQKKFGVSIEQQEVELKKWAIERGHEYVGAYSDAGISARKRYTKRPALLRLLDDVNAGKIDLIIFTKLDRWFRNVADYYEVQRILEKNGVAWKAIWEDYETETASGRLKVNIMLSVAQDEADRTSERIRKVNEYRWASGDVVQKLPAGYKREEKKVVYDPEKREAITAFFKTFMESGNVTKSVDAAAALGHYVTLVGARRMLKNRFYTGSVRGIEVPPYITEEEFQKIQIMREQYTRRPKKDNVFLFGGLLICGNCGGRLSTQKNNTTVYYVCGLYINKSRECTELEKRGYANENKLEQWLLDNLEADLRAKLTAQKGNRPETKKPDRAKLEGQLSRLKTLFVVGDISIDEYQAEKQRIRKLLDECDCVQDHPPALDLEKLAHLLPGEKWQEVYLSLSREAKRDFWRQIIRSITIYPNRPPEITYF